VTIWVVFGTTGEYSDRSEWPVAAFFHEQAAQRRVLDCQEWLLANGCARRANDDGIYRPSGGRYAALENPYDPSMGIDYTGVRYYIAEIPAVGDLPDQEVLERWQGEIAATRALKVRA